MRPAKPARRSLVLAVTAAVWTGALAFAVAGQMRLAARAPTSVNITTWPAAVRITVDGDKQFGGAYVVTPTKVTMPAGRHKVTLSRDGYFAQSSEFDDVTGRTIEM